MTHRIALDPPPVSAWLQNGFHRFLKSYLRRHFHAVAVASRSRTEHLIDADQPLIVYVNHPSWWDPLLAHFLNQHWFPQRQLYAPIDADALKQYRVFAKLGFFGVRSNSSRGAGDFLRTSRSILAASDTALWLTPEGRFADARDHSTTLMPGLAHLCSTLDHAAVLPLAIEYVFWDERLPVCLIRQGDLIQVADHPGISKTHWSDLLQTRLRDSQAALAQLAIGRSAEPFDNLVCGRQGAGGLYDTFRRSKSWVTGKKFQASHGNEFAEKR